MSLSHFPPKLASFSRLQSHCPVEDPRHLSPLASFSPLPPSFLCLLFLFLPYSDLSLPPSPFTMLFFLTSTIPFHHPTQLSPRSKQQSTSTIPVSQFLMHCYQTLPRHTSCSWDPLFAKRAHNWRPEFPTAQLDPSHYHPGGNHYGAPLPSLAAEQSR